MVGFEIHSESRARKLVAGLDVEYGVNNQGFSRIWNQEFGFGLVKFEIHIR